MAITNGTPVEEFILKGFPGGNLAHAVMFTTLLLVYLITMTGNILIIAVICTINTLHTPMYFFLVCLSFTEIFIASTTVCKLLAILISARNNISKSGCIVQSYFYYFFTSSDFLILTVMSIDRFLAICFPLRYSSIMNIRVCMKLIVACLLMSFFSLLHPTIMIIYLPFCGHVIDHFFCDSAAMLKLACFSDISSIKLSSSISSVLILVGPLIIILVSYVFIVSTVVRLPSDTGRQKSFSTCLSHLTMVTIVFGSAIFITIRPSSNYSIETDKAVNLISTVLGPLLNPFIYTLRNQKVKDSIRDKVKSKKLQ